MTLTYPEEKVLVIYNPTAGLAINGYARIAIKSFLTKHSIHFEVFQTSGESCLRALVKEKMDEGFNKVLVAGGDGTVSLVADALTGTKIPLAIIPIGTGNLIARELLIPLVINKSLRLAFSKDFTLRPIDGMRVNDHRIFLLNISIGVSPELFSNTSQPEKRLFGRLIYIIKFIKLAVNLKLRNIKLDHDGQKESKFVTEVVIANSKILGFPPFYWPEESALDDGILGCHMIRAIKISDIVKFAISLSLYPRTIKPLVSYYEIKSYVEVRSSKPLNVQADGDFIGVTPIRIELVRNVCNFIVPPSKLLKL